MSSDDSFVIATFNHSGGSNFASNILKPDSKVTIEKSKLKSKSDKVSGQKRHHVYNYKMTIDDRPFTYNGHAFGTNIQSRHGEETSKLVGSEWILAFKNKSTGTTIYKPATFLAFSPHVESVEDNDAVVVDKDGYGDLKRKLTLQFGSKKKKRALETNLANSLQDDSLNDIVNVSVTKVKKDETLEAENGEGEFSGTPRKNPASSVLPAFNPNATTPAEIFDVNDIVSPDECLLLEAEARVFAEMSHKDRKEAGYVDYICELASNFPSQQAPRELRSIYLLYFDFLIKLYQVTTKRRNFELKTFALELKSDNAEFNRRLLSKYAEEEHFKRGKTYRVFAAGKDRILGHLIVLNLLLNNFSFTLSKLGQLLPGVQDAKLTTICNLLGCTIKKIGTAKEKVISLVKPPTDKIHGGMRFVFVNIYHSKAISCDIDFLQLHLITLRRRIRSCDLQTSLMAAEKACETAQIVKVATNMNEQTTADDDALSLSATAAAAAPDAAAMRESQGSSRARSSAMAAIDEELNSDDDEEEEAVGEAAPPQSIDDLASYHVTLFNNKLIEQVRNHPNLWDSKHPHYADYGRAIDAWEEIGKCVNQTPQECKRYFKYLRDHYVKLVRRKFELKLEGKECELVKPWQHYDQMSFLNSTIKFRRANMVGVGYVGGSEFSVRNDKDYFCVDSGKLNATKQKSAEEEEKRKSTRKRRTKNLEGDYLNELYLKLLNPADTICSTTPPEKSSASEMVCQVESSTSNDYLGRLVEDTIKNLHPSLQAKGRLSIKKLLCELEEKSLRIYEQQRQVQQQQQQQQSPKLSKRRKMYNTLPSAKPSSSSSNGDDSANSGHRTRSAYGGHNPQICDLMHNRMNVVVDQSMNSQNGFMVPVKNDTISDDKDQLYAVSFLDNTD